MSPLFLRRILQNILNLVYTISTLVLALKEFFKTLRTLASLTHSFFPYTDHLNRSHHKCETVLHKLEL